MRRAADTWQNASSSYAWDCDTVSILGVTIPREDCTYPSSKCDLQSTGAKKKGG
jgi:hypothetical protein